MKFKERSLVDAEMYRPGLEDAFGYRVTYGDGVDRVGMVYDGLARPVVPDPKIHGPLVPVILTPDGAEEIRPGDWIVTDARGNRRPCPSTLFGKLYEPAP